MHTAQAGCRGARCAEAISMCPPCWGLGARAGRRGVARSTGKGNRKRTGQSGRASAGRASPPAADMGAAPCKPIATMHGQKPCRQTAPKRASTDPSVSTGTACGGGHAATVPMGCPPPR
eukprot:scaffold11865_cov103-Isochrysis_galbana.AAC.2